MAHRTDKGPAARPGHPGRDKGWPGEGRGQRWRRPRQARANYKSQQLPLRPSASPSRSPGAPGGAAGPRGPPAGLAGGGLAAGPRGAGGRGGPGRGEGRRVSVPASGSAGGALGEGWRGGPGKGRDPGRPLCTARSARRPPRPGRAGSRRDVRGRMARGPSVPSPPLRPQERAQPELGALYREGWGRENPSAWGREFRTPLPWRRLRRPPPRNPRGPLGIVLPILSLGSGFQEVFPQEGDAGVPSVPQDPSYCSSHSPILGVQSSGSPFPRR